jgi:hypothetical protein
MSSVNTQLAMLQEACVDCDNSTMKVDRFAGSDRRDYDGDDRPLDLRNTSATLSKKLYA